ncbi:MAG: hypothetical protein LUD18_02825 [Lachnospiraceae bacterium]|nr:hypothetical protein [Lachnospiraceae bacterium]
MPIPNTVAKRILKPILQITPSRIPIMKFMDAKPLPMTIAWNEVTIAEKI